MTLGIVGLGVVGSAIKYGFSKLGHQVVAHDLSLDTRLCDVLGTQICYICVPTPSSAIGSCDTSIVEEVVKGLSEKNYDGVIAIKSTVSPGTTEKLIKKYENSNICFVPEFLRERCAEVDFTEKHDLCIVGTHSEEVYDKVRRSHGKYPKVVKRLTPTEAELAKYFNNIFNATLITFANSFYEVCTALDVNYSSVKECMVEIDHIPDKYLDCNSAFRGFGGMCLPKDTAAIAALCQSKGLDIAFFMTLLTENDKYDTTVFEGMRKE